MFRGSRVEITCDKTYSVVYDNEKIDEVYFLFYLNLSTIITIGPYKTLEKRK